jgi:hypothetical protein
VQEGFGSFFQVKREAHFGSFSPHEFVF